MSTSLLMLAPVALLFIVSGLCFVGCGLDTRGSQAGEPTPDKLPPNAYSDEVENTLGIVAYWPLNETSPDMKAEDVIAGHNGKYIHKGNMDVYYPCPIHEVSMSNPKVNSALANGFISLGADPIVLGDAVQPPAKPLVLKTGMTVDGGFVTVPLPPVIDTLNANFTVEAWVRADSAPGATHAIVDSRGFDNGVTGFVLWINDAGDWEVLLNGQNGVFVQVPAGKAVEGKPTHVVMQYNGSETSVFIDGDPKGGPTALDGGALFRPNTTHPLIIGAGFRFLPERTVAKEDHAFPLIPFKGTIQNVAVYNSVLSPTQIKTHFLHGNAMEG